MSGEQLVSRRLQHYFHTLGMLIEVSGSSCRNFSTRGQPSTAKSRSPVYSFFCLSCAPKCMTKTWARYCLCSQELRLRSLKSKVLLAGCSPYMARWGLCCLSHQSKGRTALRSRLARLASHFSRQEVTWQAACREPSRILYCSVLLDASQVRPALEQAHSRLRPCLA